MVRVFSIVMPPLWQEGCQTATFFVGQDRVLDLERVLEQGLGDHVREIAHHHRDDVKNAGNNNGANRSSISVLLVEFQKFS